MTQRLLIIACLTFAAIPLRLGATCPYPRPPCEELAKADLVFIAEVLEATSVPRRDEQGRPYPEGITHYRFNVLEGLKGIEAGEFEAQFYFGGGKDLDSFTPGSRYLIFATRGKTGIYMSGCSLTREITKTGEREWLPAMRAELSLCLKKP
jgi:hypothetical protein